MGSMLEELPRGFGASLVRPSSFINDELKAKAHFNTCEHSNKTRKVVQQLDSCNIYRSLYLPGFATMLSLLSEFTLLERQTHKHANRYACHAALWQKELAEAQICKILAIKRVVIQFTFVIFSWISSNIKVFKSGCNKRSSLDCETSNAFIFINCWSSFHMHAIMNANFDAFMLCKAFAFIIASLAVMDFLRLILFVNLFNTINPIQWMQI